MWVAEDPVTQDAKVEIAVTSAPTTFHAQANILWDVLGGASSGPTPKNFGSVDPVVTLAPGTGSRDYDVKVGFDDNDDTLLELGEIDRIITVHVLKLDWKVSSTNQNGSTPIDMFGGESVNYEAIVTGTTPDPLSYAINAKHPDGSDFPINRSGDNDLTVNFIPEPVPNSDLDHHYSFPTNYSITVGGHTLKSPTVEMEIYALWINSFRDDATGKEWKVSVGDSIAFDAVGPTSATAWRWDMEDGVPDAWNPTGGNAQSGTGMVIPFSDEQFASNSWFGDVYGTVTVYCTSGLGNEMKLISTDMNPAKKAKVYFDPAKALDGTAPGVDKPPAWFEFWKQGAVPDLTDFTYNNNLSGYGQSSAGFWYDDLEIGPLAGPSLSDPSAGIHYPGGVWINGIYFGGATGIDCAEEVAFHEKQHNTFAHYGGTDSDSDGLPDSLETYYGTTIGNPDTFNLAAIKSPVYATSGDNEYATMVEANGKKGNASQDWSKGGKQW
jgi:hypothetical protein